MSSKSGRKMSEAIELIRRGGTLLSEACPKCGGLQVRFKGRTLCVNCDDLSEVSRIETFTVEDVVANLKDLVLGKVNEASSHLKAEADVEKQSQIASLLLKYMELIEKISKIHGKE